MKVLIDILHPAHINFFKNIVAELSRQGNEVVITALARGKVPAIVEREFAGQEVHIIGRHRGTVWSILVEANLVRFFKMLYFILVHRPKVGLSVGSFVSGFCFKIASRKNYQVDDDPERFLNVALEKFTATKLFFPPEVHSDHHKVVNFNCLKEWAYLSPKYFRPNTQALEEYGLSRNGYFFVRVVSTGTLNYIHQERDSLAAISHSFPDNFPVLLSLEDKSSRSQYPEEWTVLQEPVKDIHSLMYFSKAVISTGDSMAREGAMLGVPAVYCGKRDMHANKLLIDRGMLFHLSVDGTLAFIHQLVSGEVTVKEQSRFRSELLQDWDDINQLLLDTISIGTNKK